MFLSSTLSLATVSYSVGGIHTLLLLPQVVDNEVVSNSLLPQTTVWKGYSLTCFFLWSFSFSLLLWECDWIIIHNWYHDFARLFSKMAIPMDKWVLVSPSTLSIIELGNFSLSGGCKVISHCWFSSLLSEIIFLSFLFFFFLIFLGFSILLSPGVPFIAKLVFSFIYSFCLLHSSLYYNWHLDWDYSEFTE